MRKMANIEYYKASGRCSGFDLLALFVLELIAVSVLSLPYVALLCYLEKGFGRVLSLLLFPILTAWFNGWLGMVIVKRFKIRAPGMVFCTAFFAALLGSFCAWGGVWALGQNELDFTRFISTANQTMKSTNDQYFLLGLWVACCLMMSVLPLLQAGHPFNEEAGRWFKRKSLRPFKVKFSDYEFFSVAMSAQGDIVNFFNGTLYTVTSNAIFISHLAFLSDIYKIWLYYDSDVDACYITILERTIYAMAPWVRNKTITRVQAKAIHQNLA